MKWRRIIAVVVPAVLVIAAGVGIRAYLVATKPEPARVEREAHGILVEVMEATKGDHEVALQAQGTVVPAEQVVVVPQVGGRIVWLAEEMVPGGRFTKGQRLLRIDPRDYQVQVEQRAADLNRARLEQQIESGRARVAQREWELFDDQRNTPTEEGRALALREPQVENAEVTVRAAESAVERARLDLGRTNLSAPFNAFVQSESVDLGQVVGPTSQLATLVGTDAFWVRLSVPVEALAHVRVPGYNAADEGAVARIVHDLGEERVEREGRILRLYGDLDPVGQMARLLVEVRDPLGLEREDATLPLLLGSYVRVAVEATPVRDAVEVPRIALRDGDNVWIMNEADQLEIREVGVAWRLEDSVLVRRGIEPGERIVVSRIPSPVDGMALRTESAGGGDATEARAEAAP